LNDAAGMLEAFDPITLEEMDRVRLMDRTDTKYVFHEDLLPGVLESLRPHYRVLEVNGRRRIGYESVYYDTADLSLFHQHQRGALNRYKVRCRSYVNSGLSFFEIKFKNNKERTIKKRIRQEGCEGALSREAADFLRLHTPLSAGDLHAEVKITFNRITLVNRGVPERVTIDTGLAFRNARSVRLDGLCVAEAKQERSQRSEFVEWMRHHHVRTGSVSKYCLGVALLHPGIRQNNFKPRMIRINKLIHDPAGAHHG
jgi:hypothetical protein